MVSEGSEKSQCADLLEDHSSLNSFASRLSMTLIPSLLIVLAMDTDKTDE